MFLSQTSLFLFLVILTRSESATFRLNEHDSAAVGHPGNGCFNINKADAIETTLQKLETNVQKTKTHMEKLMKKVFLTLNEMIVMFSEETSDLRNTSLEIKELTRVVKKCSGK